MAEATIDVIDIQPYLAGDAIGTHRVVEAVGAACEEIGFLVIAGHGIPDALVRRVFEVSLAFFDRPLAEKLALRSDDPGVPRGYSALASKSLGRTYGLDTPPDLREQFFVGPLDDWAAHFQRFPGAAKVYAPNVWPARRPSSARCFTAYYRAQERLARDLMRIFALALGLPEALVRRHDRPPLQHLSEQPLPGARGRAAAGPAPGGPAHRLRQPDHPGRQRRARRSSGALPRRRLARRAPGARPARRQPRRHDGALDERPLEVHRPSRRQPAARAGDGQPPADRGVLPAPQLRRARWRACPPAPTRITRRATRRSWPASTCSPSSSAARRRRRVSVDYLDRLAPGPPPRRSTRCRRAVRERACLVIADSLGVTVHGMQVPEMREFVARHLADGRPGRASVIGAGRRADPASAALLNGTAGTWIDMNEGNLHAIGHPASRSSRSRGPLAEQDARPGRDLLAAFVVGYEVSARIKRASATRLAVHPHGTFGTIGAAVALARLLGYDPAAMRDDHQRERHARRRRQPPRAHDRRHRAQRLHRPQRLDGLARAHARAERVHRRARRRRVGVRRDLRRPLRSRRRRCAGSARSSCCRAGSSRSTRAGATSTARSTASRP